MRVAVLAAVLALVAVSTEPYIITGLAWGYRALLVGWR